VRYRLTIGLILLTMSRIAAQTPVYSTFASKARREAFYQNFLKNYIQRDLTLPLADSTEDDWSDPFYGMELMQYKTPFTLERVTRVWDHIDERSEEFTKAFLELIYTNYPGRFRAQVEALMQRTTSERVFVLCADYLLADPGDNAARTLIRKRLVSLLDSTAGTSPGIFLDLFRRRLNHEGVPTLTPPLEDLLGLLPGKVVVFSFQRSNRDYPGLAVVRRADGTFIKNKDSTFFSVPQLARSVTDLPYYVRNGNSPQGIYRMDGFGFSHNQFLGPTLNIQMRMPYEVTPARFFRDESITDTSWYLDAYKNLLPPSWREDFAMQGAFYAGRIGRREVIAHGTTIDPDYFKGSVWYPQTPSLGCLCTKELWDADGKRIYSDQQQLVDALDSAGGAEGYLVVVELDDWPGPVRQENVRAPMEAAEKAAAIARSAVYLHRNGAHHSTGRTHAAHAAG
jgi:hypothetical protein